MISGDPTPETTGNATRRHRGWVAPVLLGALVLTGCAGARRMEALARQSAEIESQWGVEVVAVRPAAAGQIIDFRYRVIDPAKAAPLVDRTVDAYLVEERTGVSLGVHSSKVGPLRQTMRFGQPPAGRVLFVLFANPGGLIQSGDRVTVVVGDFKAQDLRVQ